MKHEALIKRLETTCLGLDAVDPLRLLVDDVVAALRGPEQEQQIETLKRCLLQMQEAAKDLVEQAKSLTPPQRTWVDLSDAQIGQVYFDVVQVHRGAPMPWGQVQFGRALLDKFKEVNT